MRHRTAVSIGTVQDIIYAVRSRSYLHPRGQACVTVQDLVVVLEALGLLKYDEDEAQGEQAADGCGQTGGNAALEGLENAFVEIAAGKGIEYGRLTRPGACSLLNTLRGCGLEIKPIGR